MALTTAATPHPRSFSEDRLQQFLLAAYAAVWVWAAISPVSRMDWVLENLLVIAGAAFLIGLYRRCPLSDVASILLTAFFILHTVGSHYTYSQVPLGDWLKQVLGLTRNHYDRLVHFSFGLLLAYPFRETLLRTGVARGAWASIFAFSIIASCSALYEIMEWLVGAIVDPQAGMAFLGTQGDEFDSQKDSGMAIFGAVVALVLIAVGNRNVRKGGPG